MFHPTQLGPRFERAFCFAFEKHARQTRKKTGVPYISHLMAVAALVLEAGGDEELAIAGLLHDVAEDCGGRPMLEEVRRRFGDRVAHIVEGCTDTFTLPKPAWRERKLDYLEVLRRADADIHVVCSADKLHNVRTILADFRLHGDQVFARSSGGREGTLWYNRAVLDVLSSSPPSPILPELARVVAELEVEAAQAATANSRP